MYEVYSQAENQKVSVCRTGSPVWASLICEALNKMCDGQYNKNGWTFMYRTIKEEN